MGLGKFIWTALKWGTKQAIGANTPLGTARDAVGLAANLGELLRGKDGPELTAAYRQLARAEARKRMATRDLGKQEEELAALRRIPDPEVRRRALRDYCVKGLQLDIDMAILEEAEALAEGRAGDAARAAAFRAIHEKHLRTWDED